VGFAEERDMVERALEQGDADDRSEPMFPPVARRFLKAREAAGLTQREVAARWGQQPSMYWDLEFHDNEAFDAVSVSDLITLAAILQVSAFHLLFGEDPSPPLPATTCSDIIRRLRTQMDDRRMSVEDISNLVGWDLTASFADPDRLLDLPIFGLRRICKSAGVDWATMLAGPERS